MTQRARRRAGQKMHPLDQHVGGQHQLGVGRHAQQRRVITDAEHHVGTRGAEPVEVTLDQLRFRGGHDQRSVAAQCSCGSPQARRTIEYAVDKLVPVGGTKAAGQPDRLVDHHAIWHIRPMLQLVAADEQQRVLDRIELGGLAIEQGAS